jgi:hypothetical protein
MKTLVLFLSVTAGSAFLITTADAYQVPVSDRMTAAVNKVL